jgi:hypothetical protein
MTTTLTSSWPNAPRVPSIVGRAFPSHPARPSLTPKVLRGLIVEETIKVGAESPQTATSSVSLGSIGV